MLFPLFGGAALAVTALSGVIRVAPTRLEGQLVTKVALSSTVRATSARPQGRIHGVYTDRVLTKQPGDSVTNDQFGVGASNIALSGDGSVLVVGVPLHPAFDNKGKVYIFYGPDWNSVVTHVGAANDDRFGHSVAVSEDGSTVVVGVRDAPSGGTVRGEVRIYTGANWSTETIISASDKANNDRFGAAVACSSDGSYIAVCANTRNGNRGAVYVRYGVGWASEVILTASDAAANDLLGSNGIDISHDGSVVVAGAQGKNSNRGKIYIFSGASWGTETGKEASDGASGHFFGFGTRISGNGAKVISCAQGVDGSRGAVYIFEGSGWATERKYVVSDREPNDNLGPADITSDGNTIVVGAYLSEEPGSGFSESGKSYHIELNNPLFEVWGFAATIASSVQHGYGVAIAPNDKFTYAIGARDDPNSSKGRVTIFTKRTWVALTGTIKSAPVLSSGLSTKLQLTSSPVRVTSAISKGRIHSEDDDRKLPFVSSDPADSHEYGWRVKLSADGTYALVTEDGWPNAGDYNGRGHILYGPDWTTVKTIVPSDSQTNSLFGYNADIADNGSVAVFSSPWFDDPTNNIGKVYVYSGTDWATVTELQASDKAAQDRFGIGLAISGDGSVIAVGSIHKNAGGSNRGRVYVYSGTNWATETIINPSDPTNGDFFGDDLELSNDGSVLVVGATGNNGGRGKTYVFSGTNWVTETQLNPGVTLAVNDNFGAYVDVSGDGSKIVVGAPSSSGGLGKAFLFSGASWGTVQRLEFSQPRAQSSGYGTGISITSDGTRIAIGLPFWEEVGEGVGTNDGLVVVVDPTNPLMEEWHRVSHSIFRHGSAVDIAKDDPRTIIASGYPTDNVAGKVVIHTKRTWVALQGVVRSHPRLVGNANANINTTALAGVVRSTGARLQGKSLVYYAKATPVKVVTRLRGQLGVRTPVAGRIRSLPARNFAQLNVFVPVEGTIVGGSGRLFGSLTTDVDVAGTVRATTSRLTGQVTSDLSVSGTIRGSNARLTGAIEQDTAVSGTIRGTTARLIGSVEAKSALQGRIVSAPTRLNVSAIELFTKATQVRSIARLYGQLSTRTPLVASPVRGTWARLYGSTADRISLAGTIVSSARLYGNLESDVSLSSVVRSGGRLFGAVEHDLSVAGTVRQVSYVLIGSIEPVTPLAGTVRSTSARLFGVVEHNTALVGRVVSGGRLYGAVEQDVALVGTVRHGLYRAYGTFATGQFFTGTLSATPTRLFGQIEQTVDLSGTIRSLPVVRGAVVQTIPLEGTLRGSQRLVGQLGFLTVEPLEGTISSIQRLTGDLTFAAPGDLFGYVVAGHSIVYGPLTGDVGPRPTGSIFSLPRLRGQLDLTAKPRGRIRVGPIVVTGQLRQDVPLSGSVVASPTKVFAYRLATAPTVNVFGVTQVHPRLTVVPEGVSMFQSMVLGSIDILPMLDVGGFSVWSMMEGDIDVESNVEGNVVIIPGVIA